MSATPLIPGLLYAVRDHACSFIRYISAATGAAAIAKCLQE